MVEAGSRWISRSVWVMIGLAGAAVLAPTATGGQIAGSDAAAAVLLCLLGIGAVALLPVVSRRSPVTQTALALGSLGGVITGLAWFALMPFERAGSALAGRLPGGLGWILAGAVVLTIPCAVFVMTERREPGQGGYALWHVSAVAALTVFATAVVIIRLFPGAIPDIVPARVVWQGDGPAAAAQYARDQSAIEAVDPYVLPLVIGILLLCSEGVVAALTRRRPGLAHS
jgi:hypothetical protein